MIHRTFYENECTINFAEMAVVLITLICAARRHQQPTTFTLNTDSGVVYYTLRTGKGTTLRQNQLLQELYCTYLKIKMERGHGLAVSWVPSEENLADPLFRGVLA
jgi:hypothetical protein